MVRGKVKFDLCGEVVEMVTYAADEEYSIQCARDWQREHPGATAQECLNHGRAALKAARAAMTPQEIVKDDELKTKREADAKAERERKETAKIAEAEAAKPESAMERKERVRQETPPIEYTDEQMMAWQMEEMGKRHPEWDMAHLIREARAATHKTADERARHRAEAPAVRAISEAKRQGRTDNAPVSPIAGMDDATYLGQALKHLKQQNPEWPAAKVLQEARKLVQATRAQRQQALAQAGPCTKAAANATIPADRVMSNAEVRCAAQRLDDLRILHPDWSTADLLRELRTAKS